VVGKEVSVAGIAKEMREVIEPLLRQGWTLRQGGHKARLHCPCENHCTTLPVPGTPRSPGNAAKRIGREAARCPLPAGRLTYIAPIERIDAALADHRAWLDRYCTEGTFLASGGKVPREGGIIIATGDDRARIEEVVKSDPFSVAGLARYSITEFLATKTAPPLEPYRQQLSL